MRVSFTITALALAACSLACNSSSTVAPQPKFSEADIQKTEADIRTKFEQKGFIVEQVSMVRDSDRHMSGYAKMRKPGLVMSRIDLTRNCTATMDEGTGQSIWECKASQ